MCACASVANTLWNNLTSLQLWMAFFDKFKAISLLLTSFMWFGATQLSYYLRIHCFLWAIFHRWWSFVEWYASVCFLLGRKGDVFSYFWLLHWVGNTHSSLSCWCLGISRLSWNKMACKTAYQKLLLQLHKVKEPGDWTRSHPRPTASSSLVQLKQDLIFQASADATFSFDFLHTDWRDWQLLWMLHCYKK